MQTLTICDGMKMKQSNRFLAHVNVDKNNMEAMKEFASNKDGFIIRNDDWGGFNRMIVSFPSEDLAWDFIAKLEE